MKLFSQPGKHAFSPIIELFELIPNLVTCTDEDAGNMGLILTKPFYGIYKTNDEIDNLVYEYLQTYRFKPSMVFDRYEILEDLYVPWEDLYKEIPQRIQMIVKQLRRKLESR